MTDAGARVPNAEESLTVQAEREMTEPTAGDVVMTLRDVAVAFGGRTAVRDVSFDVSRGRGHRPHRAVRFGQDHAAAGPQPDARRRALGLGDRHGPARRSRRLRRRHRPHPAAQPGGHGVPAPQSRSRP